MRKSYFTGLIVILVSSFLIFTPQQAISSSTDKILLVHKVSSVEGSFSLSGTDDHGHKLRLQIDRLNPALLVFGRSEIRIVFFQCSVESSYTLDFADESTKDNLQRLAIGICRHVMRNSDYNGDLATVMLLSP